MGYPMTDDFLKTWNPKGLRSWTCGARTRSGGLCQNYAMANGRCRLHGGMSLKADKSPRFKHGQYSKYHKEGDPHE